MASVFKYYLDDTEYKPLNTGGFTIDYTRERESGSYQYVKSIGGTINYDNKNGAYAFVNLKGDCQKILITIKEFCQSFPDGVDVFNGYFIKKECSFNDDLQIVKVNTRQDTYYQRLKDNYDRNFNLLETPTVVSSTYAQDVSQYEYHLTPNPAYASLTRPKPFFGLPVTCPGPSSPFFGLAFFARERRTTYCQGGEPQAPPQGTGQPWSILTNSCEATGQVTWYRLPEQLAGNACAIPLIGGLTSCPIALCTPPPPPVTAANETWVLLATFDTSPPQPPGAVSYWLDENSIPRTLEEIDNGRLLTEIINHGLNQHEDTKDLDLQSSLLFDETNPVTGISPSTTYQVQVHAISDVKNPSGSEPATREDITLRGIFEDYIEGKLNSYWRVDEGTKRLIIEHISQLNSQGVIDLVALSDGKYLRNKNAYEYDNTDIPRVEEFPSSDASIDFTGVDIKYDNLDTAIPNNCSTGKKTYNTDKYYSEVESIRLNPDNYPKKGVVMITPDSLAPPNSVDADDVPIGVRSENGAITGDYLPNAPQGMSNLHGKFWPYNRPFDSGEINFIDKVFEKNRPVKIKNPITFPLCCFFLFFPTSAFNIHESDESQLISASFSPSTGKITVNLEY